MCASELSEYALEIICILTFSQTTIHNNLIIIELRYE
jgi:hypothetical protein